MTTTEAARTAHAVLDHLRDQATPGPHIRDQTAWRRTIRNQLRTRHWPTLIAILDGTDQERITTIARLLEPPATTTDPYASQQAAFNQRCTEDAQRIAEHADGVPMPDRARAALPDTVRRHLERSHP